MLLLGFILSYLALGATCTPTFGNVENFDQPSLVARMRGGSGGRRPPGYNIALCGLATFNGVLNVLNRNVRQDVTVAVLAGAQFPPNTIPTPAQRPWNTVTQTGRTLGWRVWREVDPANPNFMTAVLQTYIRGHFNSATQFHGRGDPNPQGSNEALQVTKRCTTTETITLDETDQTSPEFTLIQRMRFPSDVLSPNLQFDVNWSTYTYIY